MNPVLVSLSGTGQYSLAMSPQVLDFGADNLVNSTSAARTVTVTNGTSAAVGYTLASTGPFNVNNQCANPVPAQKTCTIAVAYAPTAVEFDTGSLTITADGSTIANSVAIYGTSTLGSIMSVAGDFKFPDTAVSKTATGSIRIANAGRLALSAVKFGLSGNESSDFTFTPSQCSTIPVGGSCTVALTFTPAAEGGRYASITITSDASNSPRIVTLTGLGTSGQANASLSPSSPLDFGKQDQGSQSAASTVTLSNSGSAALAITSINSSADFPETHTCGTSLAAGSSCTISIAFAPSQVGAEAGTLTITDSVGVQTLALSGTGTAPTVAIAPASGGSLTTTVSKGQTATWPLALTGSSGFNGTVSLACSGAPQYAACTLSSSSLTLTPGSTQPFTARVTTQTTTPAAATRTQVVMGAGVLAFCLLIVRRRRSGFLLAGWCGLAVLALTALSSCGGGGGGSSTPPPVVNYTAPGTYNLTITATTSGATAISQTIVLTVQ